MYELPEVISSARIRLFLIHLRSPGTYRSLAPYVHEEELVGFPVVFWDNKTGLSVGIAPINPSSHPADSTPLPALVGVRAETVLAAVLPGQIT